jgi:hypothetical protein
MSRTRGVLRRYDTARVPGATKLSSAKDIPPDSRVLRVASQVSDANQWARARARARTRTRTRTRSVPSCVLTRADGLSRRPDPFRPVDPRVFRIPIAEMNTNDGDHLPRQGVGLLATWPWSQPDGDVMWYMWYMVHVVQ